VTPRVDSNANKADKVPVPVQTSFLDLNVRLYERSTKAAFNHTGTASSSSQMRMVLSKDAVMSISMLQA
jgi:hypothetical protein